MDGFGVFINFYTLRSIFFVAKEVLSGSGRPRRGNPNKVGSTFFLKALFRRLRPL
jgi:hypothetical protein